MKKIQDIAAGLFIICVMALTAISVLGVWEFFARDVIWKSFQTLGLLAIVAVVVIIAGRFVGKEAGIAVAEAPALPNPFFRGLRNFTLVVLIATSVLLAFVGVLAIWEVIASSETVYRSLSSLAILAFSSLIIVMCCLERENNPLWQRHGRGLSGGGLILLIILAWAFASMIF